MSNFSTNHGECLDVLREMQPCSVDAIVTDPPYGLSFMGKKWDYDVPAVEVWSECLRVLKPGGHLLAFAGTRTQHRMCVRIEDAGFEIRDMIAWLYGSGFPKSLDVSKAIDKAAGLADERGYVPATGGLHGGSGNTVGCFTGRQMSPVPVSALARQWQGWGTALKPAMEPITVARKPLEGTVAANVQRWGTGAINVDGCRVGTETRWNPSAGNKNLDNRHTVTPISRHGETLGRDCFGRWPANIIHDGSEEVVGLTGSAARFFYCAKASKRDREEGILSHPNLPRKNHHPTVKPTDLMRYLCRLVTPPGGTVLDPFMGSGSTGKGAVLEGFNFIGIEREAEYVEIAKARIAAAMDHTPLIAGGAQ